MKSNRRKSSKMRERKTEKEREESNGSMKIGKE